jgi:hypothetical protein
VKGELGLKLSPELTYSSLPAGNSFPLLMWKFRQVQNYNRATLCVLYWKCNCLEMHIYLSVIHIVWKKYKEWNSAAYYYFCRKEYIDKCFINTCFVFIDAEKAPVCVSGERNNVLRKRRRRKLYYLYLSFCTFWILWHINATY